MSDATFKMPTVEELLEAGAHFGHQAKRWNPLMKKFIYGAENKTHIVDLYQTQDKMQVACAFLYEVAKSGKQVVFVGTKRQASDIVEKCALDAGALFVVERWLGGTFTNYESVQSKWKRLQMLMEKREKHEFDKFTKKEKLLIDREIDKLTQMVGGIQGMHKFPGAIVVVDVKREHTAVHEAELENVPVVGIVDTNSDPRGVKYVIPANDDAMKSIEMVISSLAEAVKKGNAEFAKGTAPATTSTTPVTPATPVLQKPEVKKEPVVAVKVEEKKVEKVKDVAVEAPEEKKAAKKAISTEKKAPVKKPAKKIVSKKE